MRKSKHLIKTQKVNRRRLMWRKSSQDLILKWLKMVKILPLEKNSFYALLELFSKTTR